MSASIVPLEARDLSVLRGAKTVLRRVSAEFIRPQWTAIVGPNGAGKSTLLAALAGLLPASSGTVRLDGRPIEEWAHPDRAGRLTWFGQTGSVEGDIAAREIVRLGRLPRFGLFGSPSIGDENAVRAAMEETDAVQFSNRRIGELSAGERQRVLLARAFASNAPVSLFDEPTVHLDAPHQRRLIHSFTARACGGAIVISVLHDLSLALAADRMIVMKDGRIRADGHPESDAVRTTLASVFDHAISIQPVGSNGRPRWAAVPSL